MCLTRSSRLQRRVSCWHTASGEAGQWIFLMRTCSNGHQRRWPRKCGQQIRASWLCRSTDTIRLQAREPCLLQGNLLKLLRESRPTFPLCLPGRIPPQSPPIRWPPSLQLITFAAAKGLSQSRIFCKHLSAAVWKKTYARRVPSGIAIMAASGMVPMRRLSI